MNRLLHSGLVLGLCLTLGGLVYAQGDTTMTVTAEGNVGIGITNPEAKLHVSGSLTLDNGAPGLGRLMLKTNGFNDPGRYGILFSNNQIAPFLGDDLGNQIYAFFSVWGAQREFDAALEIHGKAAGSWGKMLRLTHDGTDGHITTDTGNLILNPADGNARVGIGTLDPIDKLEVAGAVTIDGNGELLVLRMRQNDSLRWSFFSAPWIDNDLRLRNEGHADVLVVDRETSNVGIRTNNPAGTLDVNGSIYQRGNQLYADYVLRDDYKLETIDEHAIFMWENKHLKGIPKAKVDENGLEIVEVGSHRKGIVEELEKAHIYIEQLHKRMKALEEKLAQLENSQ